MANCVDRVVVGGATAGNDWLGGYQDMVNRIDGLGGNDQLNGGGCGDVLLGGDGHDVSVLARTGMTTSMAVPGMMCSTAERAVTGLIAGPGTDC